MCSCAPFHLTSSGRVDLILMSNSLCFLCFSGDQMAGNLGNINLSEEELSDSSSANSYPDPTVSISSGETEPSEEESPEVPGQEWIAPKPRNIRSVFAAYPQGTFTAFGNASDWKVHFPDEDDRVCSEFRLDRFCVYEYLFKDMGLRLPFTEFQMAVLDHLDLAPT